jgi:hypothetical protein
MIKVIFFNRRNSSNFAVRKQSPCAPNQPILPLFLPTKRRSTSTLTKDFFSQRGNDLTHIQALCDRANELRKVELIHIHTFSDGLIDLVKSGVVTGEDKKVLQNLIAASYAMLSNKLYKFIDANRMVVFKDAGYTNDTAIIRYNPKVVAINSAIEIDITAQVCADSIGTMQHYGF